MSKRYGRIQKRKAAQLLAAEVRSKECFSALLVQEQRTNLGLRVANDELRVANDELRETVDLVAEILGPNFIGLPPNTREVDMIRPEYRHPIMRHLPDYSRMSRGEVCSAVIEHLTIYTRELSKTEAEEFNTFRNMIHFRYHTHQGDVAYGYAEEPGKRLSPAAFVKIHARDIAWQMAELMGRNRGK